MKRINPHIRILRQVFLLATLTIVCPMSVFGVTAGRANFVIGNVEAVNVDGSRRLLSKGSAINEGDSINTGVSARAQLQFSDGGYISLQPNTVFRVDQFNYKNKDDGSEKGFFSLLKGSLRAITGIIGHKNKDTYKVTTSTATIGIRGTGYNAEIRENGLFVSVGEGAVFLSNNAGGLLVSNGSAAFVSNINSLPTQSKDHPRTPPANMKDRPRPPPPNNQPFNGNNADNTNPPVNQLPPLPKMLSGDKYTIAYAFYSTATGPGAMKTENATTSFNNTGQVSQLTNFTNFTGDTNNLGTAAVTFAAADGIIGWGRWDGSTIVTGSSLGMGTGLTPGTFHYVAGLPTAVMPTAGVVSYNMMGNTIPSVNDGTTGWKVSGSLSADFSTLNVALNLNVSNTTTNYGVSTASATRSGANFSASTALTTTGCMSACTSLINGFFAGANASRAGLSYQINDGPRNVQGVAVFASPVPPPL